MCELVLSISLPQKLGLLRTQATRSLLSRMSQLVIDIIIIFHYI